MSSSDLCKYQKARRDIQDYLTGHLKNPHSLADAYVCYEDILEAWSGKGTIETVLFKAVLQPADIDTIHGRLLRFLSILVYIGANDFLSGPRSNFFREDGEPVYDDKHLPAHHDEVPPIENFTMRTRFLNEQYIFLPVSTVVVAKICLRFILVLGTSLRILYYS